MFIGFHEDVGNEPAGVLHMVSPGLGRLPCEETREVWNSRGAICYTAKYLGNSLVREVVRRTLPGPKLDSADSEECAVARGRHRRIRVCMA